MPIPNEDVRKRKAAESDEEAEEEEEEEEAVEEAEGEGGSDEEGDEVEFEFTCDGCSEGLYSEDTRFHCEECEDFDLCENCFFDEETESTHEHPLIEIKEGQVLFVHHDDKTGNSLILSDFRAVLPPSTTIKKHNIKSVLSAVDFHPDGNCDKDLDKLQALYSLSSAPSIPSSSTVCREGVVYHHMNMPDLQKPSLLRAHGLPHALEEACAFMDIAMARGNTLVHCQRGQFRSPTLILSWLITRGMTAKEAIDHIASDYKGWGKKYTSSRTEWVERLEKWEKDGKKERQTWNNAHHSQTQIWKAKYPSSTSSASSSSTSSSSSKDEKNGKSEKSEKSVKGDVAGPIKKKVKV